MTDRRESIKVAIGPCQTRMKRQMSREWTTVEILKNKKIELAEFPKK